MQLPCLLHNVACGMFGCCYKESLLICHPEAYMAVTGTGMTHTQHYCSVQEASGGSHPLSKKPPSAIHNNDLDNPTTLVAVADANAAHGHTQCRVYTN